MSRKFAYAGYEVESYRQFKKENGKDFFERSKRMGDSVLMPTFDYEEFYAICQQNRCKTTDLFILTTTAGKYIVCPSDATLHLFNESEVAKELYRSEELKGTLIN